MNDEDEQASTQAAIEKMQARVKRGAAYFDTHDPGWEHTVDLERLNMAKGNHCVLAQVGGSMRRDGLRFNDAVDLGFYSPWTDSVFLGETRWLLLTEMWRLEILARRDAATNPTHIERNTP